MNILRSIVCAAAIILGAGSFGQAQATGNVNFDNLSAEASTLKNYTHNVSYDDCPPYYGSSYYGRPYGYGYRPYRRHYGYGYRPYYRRHY